jgi:hypothetical protein
MARSKVVTMKIEMPVNKAAVEPSHAAHAPQGFKSGRPKTGGRKKGTPDCMSFPKEATHPRCYGEGYPDEPGRASNKEGES